LSNQGVIEQSTGGLRQLIEAGEGVVGYIYPHTPIELILAHGLTPSLLRAVPGVPSGYEASLQTFACSYVRNLYSLRADEQMPPLAGILFPSNTCDSLQNVADVWRVRFPNDRLLRLTYPVSYGGANYEAATEFLTKELRLLSDQIEALFNRKFSSEAYDRAVSMVSQFRDGARFLYAARAVDPSVLPYSDLARVMRAFLTAPTRTVVSEMGSITDHVRSQTEAAGLLSLVKKVESALATGDLPPDTIPTEGDGPRVLVAGGMIEPESVSVLINGLPNASESIIVLDLLSFGFKSMFTKNIDTGAEPFGQMAKSLLSAPGEPTQEGLTGRLKLLSSLIEFLGIDGVVLFEQSFCDPDQFEAPSIENACSIAEARTVRVPIDPELSDRARMEVRIQSFLESIEGDGGEPA
jgi:benzoyl-CoA reductase/2-hydroxyglutaryl-CoA dehydratase subunit BcrC/BadD/HgdB